MWSGSFRRQPFRSVPSGVLVLPLAVALGFGCAGRSTSVAPSDDDDDVSGRGGTGGGGRGGSAGKGARGGSAGRGGSGGSSGTGGSDVPYVDPGCPDAAAPTPIIECDVFDTVSACAPGYACKPQIEHPYGSGCDQQVFNMRCVTPGSGTQGSPCDNGMVDCAEGFICVVGAQHGPHCLQMCPIDGPTICPSWAVCNATDAGDIGVCG